jgi:hypothetical protein
LVGCNTDGIDQNLTQDLAKAIYNDTPELRTAFKTKYVRENPCFDVNVSAKITNGRTVTFVAEGESYILFNHESLM